MVNPNRNHTKRYPNPNATKARRANFEDPDGYLSLTYPWGYHPGGEGGSDEGSGDEGGGGEGEGGEGEGGEGAGGGGLGEGGGDGVADLSPLRADVVDTLTALTLAWTL